MLLKKNDRYFHKLLKTVVEITYSKNINSSCMSIVGKLFNFKTFKILQHVCMTFFLVLSSTVLQHKNLKPQDLKEMRQMRILAKLVFTCRSANFFLYEGRAKRNVSTKSANHVKTFLKVSNHWRLCCLNLVSFEFVNINPHFHNVALYFC